MTEAENTAEQTSPPQSRKNKILKWLLMSVGLLLSLLILLLLLFYFTLRSGSLTQTAVPELKPYLEPFGVQLNKIGSLRFDLLKSIALKDLELKWQDADLGDVALSIGQFDFEYSLSELLDQRAEISQLVLQDVKITAFIRQPKTTQAIDEESKPLDLAEIEELLKNPPILFKASGIAFKNIQLDITLEQADGPIHYQGELTEANMAIVWQPEKLAGSFNVELGQAAQTNQLRLQTRLDGQEIEISVKPGMVLNLDWNLLNDDDDWRLTDSQINFESKLENLELLPATEKSDISPVRMALFDIYLNNSFSSVKKTQTSKGLKNLFPIDLSSEVSSNLTELNISNFKQTDMVLSAKIAHSLKASAKGNVNPFDDKVPEIIFDLSESLKLNDFKLQMAEQMLQSNKLSIAINSKGQTVLETSNNPTLNMDLSADLTSDQFNVEQPATTKTGTSLKIGLEPEVHLIAEAKLNSFDKPLEQTIAKLNTNIGIKNVLAVIQEAGRVANYQLGQGRVEVSANYDKTNIKLDSALDLKKLTVPELKKTVTVKNKTQLETDVNLALVSLNTELLLDTHRLLYATLNLDNKAKDFRFKHDVKLQLSPKLTEYHDAAKELAIIGEPHLRLSGNTRIKHNALNIQSADFSLLESWPLKTEGSLGLIQKQAPVVEDGIKLSGPLNLKYTINNKRNYQVDLDLAVAGVQTPPLENYLPLKLSSQNNFTWPLSVTQTNTRLDIDKQLAFKIDLKMNDNKNFLDLDSKIALNTKPEWQLYLKDLKELETVGDLHTQFNLNANIKHPFKTILDFDAEQIEKLSARVLLNTEISQNSEIPGSLLVLAKPASITQDLNWSADLLKWQSQFNIPELLLPNVAAIKDIRSTVQLNANSGFTPSKADIELYVDKGQITLPATEKDQPSLEVGHIVTPMSLVSSASWTEEDVDLEKLNLKLGADLLQIQSQGTASLDGKNAQIETKIIAQLRDKLFNKPAVSGTGSMQIPLRLTLLEGKQVAVEGEMLFNQLNIAVDDLNVQNVNGRFKLEEELLLIDNGAKFRYLLSPDPFQRVDFNRIQPYLNTDSISIEKISVGDLSLGPVLASVLLKQNIFSLQQFDIDLFSGHSAGQFYLDVRPDAWKLGLLSRITHLDPRQLLAKDSKLRNSALSPVNSRTAIEFDVHKRLMEGEIVISQINREQLLQLLDVVDPSHEDEQMAQLRKGLRISYPESVEVDMQRGLMNLKVEVAGLPKAIRVTGLPLTPMIQQFASEALVEIDQIPLQ